MNCADDSSDGEPPPGAWEDDAEEITSDGEQPAAAWAWQPAAGGEAAVALRQLNGQLPPSGRLQQQGSLEACQPRGARAFSRAAPARAPPRGSRAAATFRRPMKTAAAAEADRAAAERVAADESQLEDVLGQEQPSTAPAAGMLQPGSRPAPAPIPPPRPPAAAASFLNRRVLPPSQASVQELRQQLQRSTPVIAAAAAAAAPAAAAAAGAESGPVSVQAVQQAQWEATSPAAAAGSSTRAALDSRPSASHQAAGTLAPGMAAGAVPAATFHRTAEGLNVVHLNRQQQRGVDAHAGGRGGTKAKADSVNSGWGNNFVRIDLKVRGAGCSQGIGQGRGCEGLCTQQTCSSCQRQESGWRHAHSKRLCPSLSAWLMQKGRGSTKYGTKYGSKQRKRGGGRGGGRWQGKCSAGHHTSARTVVKRAVKQSAWQLPLLLRTGWCPSPRVCTNSDGLLSFPPTLCCKKPRACARLVMVLTSWRAGRGAAGAASSAAALATLPKTAQHRRRRTQGR